MKSLWKFQSMVFLKFLWLILSPVWCLLFSHLYQELFFYLDICIPQNFCHWPSMFWFCSFCLGIYMDRIMFPTSLKLCLHIWLALASRTLARRDMRYFQAEVFQRLWNFIKFSPYQGQATFHLKKSPSSDISKWGLEGYVTWTENETVVFKSLRF